MWCYPVRKMFRMYSVSLECFDPGITTLLETGSKFNITWIFGLDVPDNGPVNYWDGLVMYFRSTEYTRLESDLNEGTYMLESANGLIPLYCSKEHRLDVADILRVLFVAFDRETWICLAACLLLVYISLQSQTHAKKSEPVAFEIVRLILQRCTARRDVIRISVLLACFLVEFLYLSKTTEMIIVPPDVHRPSSLSELLTKHKLMTSFVKQSSPQNLAEIRRKLLIREIGMELEREGFKGNLSQEAEYWGETFYESNYSSFEEMMQAYSKYITVNNVIVLTKVKSLLGHWRAAVTDKIASSSEHKDTNCGGIAKRYGGGLSFYYIFSRFRREFSPVLQRVLYDSGLRMFWDQMRNAARQRGKKHESSTKIGKMKLSDGRIFAIFSVLITGLLLSAMFYTFERRTRTGRYVMTCHVTVVSSFKSV